MPLENLSACAQLYVDQRVVTGDRNVDHIYPAAGPEDGTALIPGALRWPST